MALDRVLLSRLFIAVPELGTDKTFLSTLVSEGILSKDLVAIFTDIAALHKGVKAPRGKPLLERIMQVAPELLSVRLMQALKAMRLVSTKDAHILSVLFKASSRLIPSPVKEVTIYQRLGLIFDDVFSPSMVNYIRALDNEQILALTQIFRANPENYGLRESIYGHRRGTLTSGDADIIRELLARSIARAQIMRAIISTGRGIKASLKDSRDLDSAWDVLTIAFDNLFSEKLLRNLIRAGVLSPERYALAKALADFGAGAWRKINLAHTYEGWAARSLLLSEGVLSPETIRVLRSLNLISPQMEQLLYPVANAIRGITRTAGAQWRKSQRYRVVPGEKPIKTYARMTTQTDKQILKLLADAARDASQEAERLAATRKFAALTRARQQQTIAGVVHRTMRDMMEDVGSLIIFGEKQAGQAALEAFTWLSKPYGQNSADLQRMLRYTAQSGIDSWISREENLRPLSRRVYKNVALLRGQVDREIAKGLIRGLSSRELAGSVLRFIHPSTPGGASYAAMRLARTEINNAFHQTQIRYTREMPWVEGYKWNLSGSHGRPDVCNEMAEHSEGLGRGVYGKGETPGKPHPMCLCYITTVTVDNATFYKRFRSGAYANYIGSIESNGVFAKDTYTPTAVQDIARSAGKIALLNSLAAVTRFAGDRLLGR